MLGRRGRRGASLKPNNRQRMHVLTPRQVPACTVETTTQESEGGNTTHPPMLPGTEKHVLPLCWTVVEPVTLKAEDKLNVPSL